MSTKKVKSEAENEEIVMNKLGLSWAKLSYCWADGCGLRMSIRFKLALFNHQCFLGLINCK